MYEEISNLKMELRAIKFYVHGDYTPPFIIALNGDPPPEQHKTGLTRSLITLMASESFAH